MVGVRYWMPSGNEDGVDACSERGSVPTFSLLFVLRCWHSVTRPKLWCWRCFELPSKGAKL